MFPKSFLVFVLSLAYTQTNPTYVYRIEKLRFICSKLYLFIYYRVERITDK